MTVRLFFARFTNHKSVQLSRIQLGLSQMLILVFMPIWPSPRNSFLDILACIQETPLWRLFYFRERILRCHCFECAFSYIVFLDQEMAKWGGDRGPGAGVGFTVSHHVRLFQRHVWFFHMVLDSRVIGMLLIIHSPAPYHDRALSLSRKTPRLFANSWWTCNRAQCSIRLEIFRHLKSEVHAVIRFSDSGHKFAARAINSILRVQ